jgi:hypothetical protein
MRLPEMGRKTHPESRVTFIKSPTAQNKYARRRKARRKRAKGKVQNPPSLLYRI